MKHWYIILPALLVFAGCKQKTTEPAAIVAQPENVVLSEYADTADLQIGPTAAEQAAPAPKRLKTPRPAVAPKPKVVEETFYVQTYGAQGKVWGHVTMKGDRGTGTIHDADENTLAVKVTRNGNELFAVDQNSRQYIFKL